MKRICNLSLLALAVLAGSAHTQGIYRSTGDYGEASFSDVETPEAAPVAVDPPVPASSEVADWVAETLEVARVLEESRLAREAAAAERRDAYRKRQQETAPAAAPEQRVTYAPWYPYPYGWRPGYPAYRPPYGPARPPHRPGRPPQDPGRPPHGPDRPMQLPIPAPGADSHATPIPRGNAARAD